MSQQSVTQHYDSTLDTLNHIGRVHKYMDLAIEEMQRRRDNHDLSKLQEPDKSQIDQVRLQLMDLEFGSPEYKTVKRQYFSSHYAQNDHHIEYHTHGVWGMNIFQILEMICDWCAAVETHKSGDNVFDSLEIISQEHKFPEYLYALIYNTLIAMGYTDTRVTDEK